MTWSLCLWFYCVSHRRVPLINNIGTVKGQTRGPDGQGMHSDFSRMDSWRIALRLREIASVCPTPVSAPHWWPDCVGGSWEKRRERLGVLSHTRLPKCISVLHKNHGDMYKKIRWKDTKRLGWWLEEFSLWLLYKYKSLYC